MQQRSTAYRARHVVACRRQETALLAPPANQAHPPESLSLTNVTTSMQHSRGNASHSTCMAGQQPLSGHADPPEEPRKSSQQGTTAGKNGPQQLETAAGE